MSLLRRSHLLLLVLVIGIAACSQDKPQTSSANVPQPSMMGNMKQAAPSSTIPPVALESTTAGDTIDLAGVRFALPAGWIKEVPSSGMRLAQYQLPGDAGPGSLTVFAFGPGQGGSASANIDRWVGQFSTSSGKAEPEVSKQEQGELTISVVKAAGTYTPTPMGPMAPTGSPLPDHSLFGIIVEGGSEGTLFIKATGPSTTMQAQEEALQSFAKSAHLTKG